MGLDVATIVQPFERLADAPFTLEVGLRSPDPTGASAFGLPEDVSDVTALRVTAQKLVARGETAPAATVWTDGDGVALVDVISGIDGLTVPFLRVTEATGLGAGTYALMASGTRAGGAVDWFFQATLELTEQP